MLVQGSLKETLIAPLNASNRRVRESDFAHIDVDQQRLVRMLRLDLVRIDSSFCWKDHSINLPIMGGIIESRCDAKDVNIVVMAPQQTIRTKTEDLYFCMALNRIREGDFQTTPGLSVNLNRSNLLTVKIFVGKEERCVDIGVKGLSAKVRDVQVIPGRELLLFPKRRFGIIAAGDDSSITTPDLDAVRLKKRSLVLAGKIPSHPFPFRLDLEDYVFQVVRLALDLPYFSGDRSSDRYGGHFAPAF